MVATHKEGTKVHKVVEEVGDSFILNSFRLENWRRVILMCPREWGNEWFMWELRQAFPPCFCHGDIQPRSDWHWEIPTCFISDSNRRDCKFSLRVSCCSIASRASTASRWFLGPVQPVQRDTGKAQHCKRWGCAGGDNTAALQPPHPHYFPAYPVPPQYIALLGGTMATSGLKLWNFQLVRRKALTGEARDTLYAPSFRGRKYSSVSFKF